MNSDTINGNWKDLKGKIKSRWAKFTDDDLKSFEGNLDSITGKIQKVYGHAKDDAEKEYNDFKKSLNQKIPSKADVKSAVQNTVNPKR